MNTLLKPSAHFVKPSFISMVESGRSLIVVETKSAANRVRDILNNTQWARLISVTHGDQPFEVALHLFNGPPMRPNGQLLMHASSAMHGFRVEVDRVIWISPGSHGYPVSYVDAAYAQSMSRADMPWGQPAKWHYSESELFN